MKKTSITFIENVEHTILSLRGQRVMLDSDLARLYQVETKNLNKAVQRNIERFPEDFRFQLTWEEYELLRFQIGTSNQKDNINQSDISSRSQFATLKEGRGGRKYLPYAFTEQGIAMLSGILNSPRAVAVNIAIMRAFVKMRGLAGSQEIIKRELQLLKHKYKDHDDKIKTIFLMMDEIIAPPTQPTKKNKIGFIHHED
jgi:hypothetical protein